MEPSGVQSAEAIPQVEESEVKDMRTMGGMVLREERCMENIGGLARQIVDVTGGDVARAAQCVGINEALLRRWVGDEPLQAPE